MFKGALLSILLALSTITFANVRLPKIFGSGMVLQRNQSIPVWGWASPGESVTVQLKSQSKTTKAGKDGKWKILLASEKAGGPYRLSVSGKDKIVLEDVLIGDVWICSGQSNMEWNVSSSANAEVEINTANYPNIRQFLVSKAVSALPSDEVKADFGWQKALPADVGRFTAVGYFFAREVFKEANIPIGLINTTWGGTIIEAWISRDGLENHEEFAALMATLPKLDLESLKKERQKGITNKISELQGGFPKDEEVKTWSDLKYDDSKWLSINLPGLWEDQQLRDFDGVVWFRKTVQLSRQEAENEATLQIGKIDDSDETFVNGIKVGGMRNEWNTQRNYSIEKGILKEGENVIVVRVEDTGGGGGILGDPGQLALVTKTNRHSLAGSWKFRVASLWEGHGTIDPNSFPTLLYNAMIHPLIPYGIKGALWYQGESNADRAFQYRKAFPLMINDWRAKWGLGNFPFYFVQLSSFNSKNGDSNNGSTWAELREAQTLTLSLPHTGMAVTTDIGESNDIHPRNKQDVGKRLAAIALKNDYGKDTVASGPVFQSIKIEGNKAIITFTNIGSGLKAADKYGYLKGFEIAGEDKKFYYAKASIEGASVTVFSELVTDPKAVRFAWADDAREANLYNNEGFPAVPFRTDNWKGVTDDSKYTVNGF